MRPLALLLLVACSFALVLGAWCPPARAQEKSAQQDPEARALDLFEESSRAYERGDFPRAVDLLKQAYALKKEPVLLYNLGRAYESMGSFREAATAYRDFLAAQPSASDRGAIERRIATLDRQATEREELERKRRAPERREERSPNALPWILVGVGVATLAAGTVFGLVALDKHSAAERDPTYLGADQAQERAKEYAVVSNVCFGVGAVLAAGGLLWGLLDLSASRSSKAQAPALTW